jgi:carbon storage regulator CsrA
MLVVSKKLGESVWLAGELPADAKIEVKVLSVRGGYVRLGIEAPPTVNARRDDPERPRARRGAQPVPA